MNCDQVFDVLTRGPFPTGHPDDAHVETHLTCCHECRALAEALRPATDLFHESLSHTAADDLPSYTGTVASEHDADLPTAVATMLDHAAAEERVTRIRERTEPQARHPHAWATFAICSAALAMFAMFGLATRNDPSDKDPQTRPDFAALQLTAKANLTEDGVRFLNELELPLVCSSPVTHSSGHVQTALQTQWNRCCTQCHSADRMREATADRIVTKMAASCGACHAATPATEDQPVSHVREVSAISADCCFAICSL